MSSADTIITHAHWLVITNPRAGKRSFVEQSKFVTTRLKKLAIPYLFEKTEYSGHAIEIAKDYAERGCLNYIIMGGDGTISEVVNGIFLANIKDTSKITISIIPRGTGNDWGRFWKISKNNRKNMEIFTRGKKRFIDIGEIAYENEGNAHKRFFINSVGFGLDAKIVQITHRLKKYVGSFAFLYSIAFLISLIKFKKYKLDIRIDNVKMSLPMITMSIANGPYSGGGIVQNPRAVPYDAVFDMNLVSKITLRDILIIIPNLYNGKINKSEAVKAYRAKKVEIQASEDTLVEADGIMVENANNCTVKIRENALQMIVP